MEMLTKEGILFSLPHPLSSSCVITYRTVFLAPGDGCDLPVDFVDDLHDGKGVRKDYDGPATCSDLCMEEFRGKIYKKNQDFSLVDIGA